MEPDEFYVYKSGYFICGGCGGSLSPQMFNSRPYRPKVACFNSNCPKYLHILVLGDDARISAFDTGERAADPNLQQPGTMVGGMGQAQANTTLLGT